MHKQGVAALVLAAWSFASCAAQAQDSIERGRYLVEGILTCGNCHSPRGPGGVVDNTRLYSGGPQTWDEPAFTVKGSNFTPDLDTGIEYGKFVDEIVKTSSEIVDRFPYKHRIHQRDRLIWLELQREWLVRCEMTEVEVQCCSLAHWPLHVLHA